MSRSILLLNLVVLVANFAVALSATESHVGVMRTTARVVHAVPLAPPPRGRPAPVEEAGGTPRARLLKYLARLDELERLSPEQVAALCRAFEHCCEALSDPAALARVRAAGGGAASRLVGELDERVRGRVAETLRAAAIPEGELLARLVRIVVSAAG